MTATIGNTDGIPAKQLERIRALLAKAEASEFEGEANTFTAAAMHLMAKYGVERAMLDATKDTIGDLTILVTAPYVINKVRLLHGIAEALRCRTVRYTNRNRKVYDERVVIIGYESDLERVNLLFTSLLLQGTGMLRRVKIPAWESDATFRRAWWNGFAWRVAARVREAEQSAAAEHQPTSSGSAELVLADRKTQVDLAFAERFPKLGKGRRTSTKSRAGLAAGHAAGNKANLGLDASVGGTGAKPLGR